MLGRPDRSDQLQGMGGPQWVDPEQALCRRAHGLRWQDFLPALAEHLQPPEGQRHAGACQGALALAARDG